MITLVILACVIWWALCWREDVRHDRRHPARKATPAMMRQLAREGWASLLAFCLTLGSAVGIIALCVWTFG